MNGKPRKMDDVAEPVPTMPAIKGFSQAFFVLKTVRATVEKIQESVLQQYSLTCSTCERKALKSHHHPKECCRVYHRRFARFGAGKDANAPSSWTDSGTTSEAGRSRSPRSESRDKRVVEIDEGRDEREEDDEGMSVEDDTRHEETKPLKRKRAEGLRTEKSWQIEDNRPNDDRSLTETVSSDKFLVESSNMTASAIERLLPDCVRNYFEWERVSDRERRKTLNDYLELWEEVGEKQFKVVVKKFQSEHQRELDMSTSVSDCRYGLACYSGATCRHRHLLVIMEPQAVFLRRLEDEAGRRLLPEWMDVHPKAFRSFGDSLREKKKTLKDNFEFGLRIAQAFITFEANRRFYRPCSFGFRCKSFFCHNNHPERIDALQAPIYVTWVLDNFHRNFYDPDHFVTLDKIFPKCIAIHDYMHFALAMWRYRTEIGVEAYDRLRGDVEELVSSEWSKQRRGPCQWTFDACNFGSDCRYQHVEMLWSGDPIVKLFMDILKDEKEKKKKC